MTTSVRPFLVRWRQEKMILHLLIDGRHNRGDPIDRSNDLPVLVANGNRLTDQRQMRQGLVKQVKDHLDDLSKDQAEETLVAYVGNGNLMANYAFVALLAGVLYHLADEPVFKRAYTCIVRWRDGHITVENLWFAKEYTWIVVLRQTGHGVEDITRDIVFATSGQPLVSRGQAVPLEFISEQWYDTRHQVKPLRITLGQRTLFVPNAQLQQGLTRKAFSQPVHVRLEARVDEETAIPLTPSGWLRALKEEPVSLAKTASFLKQEGILKDGEAIEDPSVLLRVAETTDRLLEVALKDASYDLVDSNQALKEGDARLVNGHLEIFFQKAFYPHNVFVRWPDGSCGFVVFPGQSGRAGATLASAQDYLTGELRVQDAILLDNGGDTRLWYRGHYLVPSSEGREEIRSILALTAPKDNWCSDAVVIS